jgi:hypothetical protein
MALHSIECSAAGESPAAFYWQESKNMASNALADPRVVVTLLIYTSAARLALTHFPPLWFPKIENKINWDGFYVHALRYAVLMFLLARITRTYAYAMKVEEYDMIFLYSSWNWLSLSSLPPSFAVWMTLRHRRNTNGVWPCSTPYNS